MIQEQQTIELRDSRPFWWTCVDIAVLQDKSLSMNDKAIYAVLCSYASVQDRSCFPSIALLAETAGCSERTVQRCLASLENKGYIQRQNRFRANTQISSLYTIIGYAVAVKGGDTQSPGGCQKRPTELEPTELDLKDTLSEGAEAAPDEQNYLSPDEEAVLVNEKPRSVDDSALKKIPAAMKETVEFLLLKTGRTSLFPEEIGPVMALEKIHVPSRIQREITTAVDRFIKQGRPFTALTFGYIYDSLKYQKSSKTARAQPKLAVSQSAENKEWEERNKAALMAEFGIREGGKNADG